MESAIKSLLESELLRVELIAVGLLLLLLLIKSLGVNIGNFGYVSILILLVFPILWFIGKGLINLIKRIDFPETEPWIWISLAVILLLIIFRKRIHGMRRPRIGLNWRWIAIPLLVIAGIWAYKQYQISRLLREVPTKNDPAVVYSTMPSPVTDLSSYKELTIGTENSFEAGEWKRFRFKPSNTKEQKYLNFYTKEGSTEPLILTFKQVSNGRKWQWKLWRDQDGTPQSELLSGYLEAFAGDCLVQANKESVVLVLIE